VELYLPFFICRHVRWLVESRVTHSVERNSAFNGLY
jgi:hypothetical protein